MYRIDVSKLWQHKSLFLVLPWCVCSSMTFCALVHFLVQIRFWSLRIRIPLKIILQTDFYISLIEKGFQQLKVADELQAQCCHIREALNIIQRCGQPCQCPLDLIEPAVNIIRRAGQDPQLWTMVSTQRWSWISRNQLTWGNRLVSCVRT